MSGLLQQDVRATLTTHPLVGTPEFLAKVMGDINLVAQEQGTLRGQCHVSRGVQEKEEHLVISR